MRNQLYILCLVILLLFSISGCYSKPVRHLASDIALLKVGESSQEDVVVFLGEPDEQQKLEDGTVKWLYKEVDKSLLQKTPLVGKKIGSPLYQRVVVTLKDEIVINAVYSASDEDDLDWADDYSWQVKKK